jgi:small subunit ribosomal protein S6e
MAEIKLNIGDPKTGKTYKLEVKDDQAKPLIGKYIGQKIKGELIDLTGYEFEITGGSDSCGFPMRRDARGPGRKKVLITGGVGLNSKRKGMRKRRTVAGSTIYDKTAQINLKILKMGSKPLAPEEEKKEEAKAEEKPKEAAKKEEKKVDQKPAEKKETKEEPKKEEKPAEKKEEPKAEEKPKEEKK